MWEDKQLNYKRTTIMKIKLKENKKRQYPYLATYMQDEDEPVQIGDIMVISKINKGIWAQYLNGGNEGYYTKHEESYVPLSSGSKIEIIQQ